MGWGEGESGGVRVAADVGTTVGRRSGAGVNTAARTGVAPVSERSEAVGVSDAAGPADSTAASAIVGATGGGDMLGVPQLTRLQMARSRVRFATRCICHFALYHDSKKVAEYLPRQVIILTIASGHHLIEVVTETRQ